jgi:hypothetical protein
MRYSVVYAYNESTRSWVRIFVGPFNYFSNKKHPKPKIDVGIRKIEAKKILLGKNLFSRQKQMFARQKSIFARLKPNIC